MAVAAWEVPAGFGWSAYPYNWDPDEGARKALASTVDEVLGVDRAQHVELIVREGRASAVLLDESKGAAMLVVGSRGRGGFAGLLLGSVSAAVARTLNARYWSCTASRPHSRPSWILEVVMERKDNRTEAAPAQAPSTQSASLERLSTGIQQADGFWDTVLGILQAVVWPAFLVYHVLKLVAA